MFSRPLILACFLFAAFAHPAGQDTLIVKGDEVGQLRRFTVRGVQETNEILELVNDNGLDVWQLTPSHVDIYSSPFAPPLPAPLLSFPHTETSIPVAPSYRTGGLKQVSATTRTDWNLSSFTNSTYHATYHPLYEINGFMEDIAALHQDRVYVVELGHSGEGREMLGLKISLDRSKNPKDKSLKVKKGFVITGAQHAREWIATASALYLTHALVADASDAHSLSRLLDSFDFYIIPTPNPDGYDYTWESDRYWYKNRMVLGPHVECVGLDMNRNWGYKWKPHQLGALNTSSEPPCTAGRKPPADPCSHWYPGQRAFQAPEVNNIANYIATLPKLEAFIDLRSYGQMLSSPFSFSCKKVPKDAEDQLEAALGATSALKLVHGTSFVTGSLCSTLYRASGNIVDWMYARAKIKYSYAAHLRDTGTYGFALPPGLIRPVGEETGKMVEYLARFILKT